MADMVTHTQHAIFIGTMAMAMLAAMELNATIFCMMARHR